MKKLVSLLCVLALLVLGCTSCDKSKQLESEATKLSFKSTETYATLKSLAGKTVTINGYMATSSPVDGSFMFLMNLPYQSCPFCKPNTSELSNTIEVFPKSGKSFEYTELPVKIVGTLAVAPEGQPFTDDYGYEFSFKIVDATSRELKASEISENAAMLESLSTSGLMTEINGSDGLIDYLYFISHWTEYFDTSKDSTTGEVVYRQYLSPDRAKYYVTTAGAWRNYGYVDSYYTNMIAAIRKIDANKLEDLVTIIEDAKAFSARAVAEMEESKCTKTYYPELDINGFVTSGYVYKQNQAAALDDEYWALIDRYNSWLETWEL